jgi:hypothetical protein
MHEIRVGDIFLKMWEKTMLPESIKNNETGKYEKTGRKVENTTYTFLDSEGNKLVCLSDNAQYRELEGKNGELLISLVHDDFKRINKIKFHGFIVS